MEIVGDDLRRWPRCVTSRPTSPKIKASGADSVITGNWGSDLALLIKAANDAGLNNVNFYTYYGVSPGAHRHGRWRLPAGVYGGLRPTMNHLGR